MTPFMGLTNMIDSIHGKWNVGITMKIDKESDVHPKR